MTSCEILKMTSSFIMDKYISLSNTDQENFYIVKELYETFTEFVNTMDFLKYNDFIQPIIFDMIKFFTE